MIWILLSSCLWDGPNMVRVDRVKPFWATFSSKNFALKKLRVEIRLRAANPIVSKAQNN